MNMLVLGYIGVGLIVLTVIMSVIAIYGGRRSHLH